MMPYYNELTFIHRLGGTGSTKDTGRWMIKVRTMMSHAHIITTSRAQAI